MIHTILLMLAAPALAAETPPTGITVDGQCSRRVVPDRGAITVTADALDKDVKAAVAEATRGYERVRAAVKRLPLENMELETAEYSVREEREWQKDKTVSKGFRARMGLKVTSSSIDKLGEVIGIAAREGIRDVGALGTFLSPEKLRQEQLGCLEEAAGHARSKAEKLAAALGAKIGPVLRLAEGAGDAERPPVPMMAMMKSERMADEAAPPSVEAGKRDIATTVTATFGLR
jgi:hypothetical protein